MTYHIKHTMHNIKQRGFTIVEVVAAIAVLAFGLVGVYGAFSAVIVSTTGISSRFTAVYLAQEGLEIVRNMRDNNFINSDPWSYGLVGLGIPCNTGCMLDYKTVKSDEITIYNDDVLSLNSDGFYSYNSAGTPTIFKRKITITPVAGSNGDALDVNVLILWSYGGKSFSFNANEYLYNWY